MKKISFQTSFVRLYGVCWLFWPAIFALARLPRTPPSHTLGLDRCEFGPPIKAWPKSRSLRCEWVKVGPKNKHTPIILTNPRYDWKTKGTGDVFIFWMVILIFSCWMDLERFLCTFTKCHLGKLVPSSYTRWGYGPNYKWSYIYIYTSINGFLKWVAGFFFHPYQWSYFTLITGRAHLVNPNSPRAFWWVDSQKLVSTICGNGEFPTSGRFGRDPSQWLTVPRDGMVVSN